MKQYHKSDFQFTLPESLIARYPLAERSASRMLIVNPVSEDEVVLESSGIRHLLDYIHDNDLLVFNNTRVLPARLFGQKDSGGKVEILIERVKSPHDVRAYIRASKSPKISSIIKIHDYTVEVTGRDDTLFTLHSPVVWQDIMSYCGEMPIPPYLERSADELDSERYQTVYAKYPGAVAAPTAGLHIDENLLSFIQQRNIATAEVTLHVGAGTFQPVRHDDLSQHIMHEEWIQVDESVVEQVRLCRARRGRVIAIGTTSLRALESASQSGKIQAMCGDTNLFITPGYQFHCVDALLTNFHLPESTLLMLVSAFAGYGNIQKAYQYAIREQYRFYSYGDAMFITHHL